MTETNKEYKICKMYGHDWRLIVDVDNFHEIDVLIECQRCFCTVEYTKLDVMDEYGCYVDWSDVE